MNRILLVKTRRDLRRRRAQFAAVALTVLIGVMLFIATFDAYRNLDASYDRTYSRLHFADLTATGGDPARTAAAARDSEDVARVTTRTQADVPLRIGTRGGDGTDKLIGRLVGLPPGGQPAVNRVDVTSGRYLDPADPGGVLVEKHAAKTFDLSPGDRLQVFDGSGWRSVTVRGVVDSPEYLWPAPDRQNALFDPHAFAVLFAAQGTVEELAAAAGTGQTLVELTGSARGGDATGRVADRLRAAGATDVQTRSDQPSYASLEEDLDAFSELSVAFPALFLSAAAVAAYVLMTRLVLGERRVIATFLAAGAPRSRVVRHYLGHGVLTGTVGALLGVVSGAFVTAGLTHLYTSSLGIPDTVVARRWGAALVGLLFGVLVGLIGGAAPSLATARTAPAQAMRGDLGTARPPGRWSRMLARARRLPVTWRLSLRELTRSRRRTAATMVGTVLALVLVLSSVGMVTSTRSSIDLQYGQIQREDATVTADPRAARGLQQALRGVSPVRDVEAATAVRVTASSGSRSYMTTLNGFRPDTVMHGFRTTGGHWRSLPADGVLAGKELADRLDIDVGDTFAVGAVEGAAGAAGEGAGGAYAKQGPGAGGSREVRLEGLVAEPVGTFLYGTVDTVRALTGATPDNYLLRFADGADTQARDRARATITGLAGVVTYTDEQALRDEIDHYLNLFWIFVGTMVLLGGALALTVIYVTMAVNIAERTGELATMRASGVRLRRIGAVLVTENLLATALAIPLGLVVGAVSAWVFLQTYSSDMFAMELSLGWAVLLGAAASVLAASLLSQIPAVRAIRRMDIATVVRERAQ